MEKRSNSYIKRRSKELRRKGMEDPIFYLAIHEIAPIQAQDPNVAKEIERIRYHYGKLLRIILD